MELGMVPEYMIIYDSFWTYLGVKEISTKQKLQLIKSLLLILQRDFVVRVLNFKAAEYISQTVYVITVGQYDQHVPPTTKNL